MNFVIRENVNENEDLEVFSFKVPSQIAELLENSSEFDQMEIKFVSNQAAIFTINQSVFEIRIDSETSKVILSNSQLPINLTITK